MSRRKFFKQLGLTAAVAAIAPRLLAEESAPTYNGPKLTIIYGGGQDVECYYLQAWKKPLEVAKGVTVMFLPKQLSWAKDMIIIRDTNGYHYQTIEIEKRVNVYALMVPDKLYTNTIGPIVKDEKWL